jgi:hypothetical protein
VRATARTAPHRKAIPAIQVGHHRDVADDIGDATAGPARRFPITGTIKDQDLRISPGEDICRAL